MAFRISKIPFTKNNKDIQIFNTLLSRGPMTKQMKMPAIMFIIPIDTLNKLGYKAKINTHTTSYIN